MSKNSEMKTEDREKMEEHLEAALQRVISQEQQKLLPQLEIMCSLASQKEQMMAAMILAKKERQCPPRDTEDGQAPSPEVQIDKLYLEIDDRQTALINHRVVKNALQRASFNLQMQEAVHNGLRKVDLHETMDNLTESGVFLAHCSSNLDSCKQLAHVQKEIADLRDEILDLRLKYSSVLKEIKSKWEALEDRFMQGGEQSNNLMQMQNKTKERDGKIQILLVIIQGLISACGFQWGAFEYFVQVLEFCDSALLNQDSAKQNAIMRKITSIREGLQNEGNRSTLKEMLSATKRTS